MSSRQGRGGLRFMLRLGLMLGLCCLLLLPLQAEATSSLTLHFDYLRTGSLGQVSVQGKDIKTATVTLLGNQFPALPDKDEQLHAYIAAPLETDPGTYPLRVQIIYQNNVEEWLSQELRLVSGSIGRYDLTLPRQQQALLEPALLQEELSRLEALLRHSQHPDASWYWGGIQAALPPAYGTSSLFGGYRRYNGEVWQWHTGVDYPAPLGTPVQALADGQVVFQDVLPIRGNYLLLDHGLGFFSGYAHLSDTLVSVGQEVRAGEIIGEVGSSGRSTGVHLHLETAFSGVWVNPLEVLRRFGVGE